MRLRLRQWIATVSRFSTAALFLVAAGWKVWNLREFRQYLELLWPFTHLTFGQRAVLVGVIPAEEFLIGVMLVSGLWRRFFSGCAVGFIVLATLLAAPQQDGLPRCRCLPLPDVYLQGSVSLILRNCVLLVIAGTAFITSPRTRPRK